MRSNSHRRACERNACVWIRRVKATADLAREGDAWKPQNLSMMFSSQQCRPVTLHAPCVRRFPTVPPWYCCSVGCFIYIDPTGLKAAEIEATNRSSARIILVQCKFIGIYSGEVHLWLVSKLKLQLKSSMLGVQWGVFEKWRKLQLKCCWWATQLQGLERGTGDMVGDARINNLNMFEGLDLVLDVCNNCSDWWSV